MLHATLNVAGRLRSGLCYTQAEGRAQPSSVRAAPDLHKHGDCDASRPAVLQHVRRVADGACLHCFCNVPLCLPGKQALGPYGAPMGRAPMSRLQGPCWALFGSPWAPPGETDFWTGWGSHGAGLHGPPHRPPLISLWIPVGPPTKTDNGAVWGSSMGLHKGPYRAH